MLDKGGSKIVLPHVIEHGTRRERRHEEGTIDAAFEKYGHLRARDRVVRTIIIVAATAGYARPLEGLDKEESEVRRGVDILEASQRPGIRHIRHSVIVIVGVAIVADTVPVGVHGFVRIER